MLRKFTLAVATLLVVSQPASAQKVKVDSLLILLSKPKAQVMDQVLTAFTEQGLDVTDNSGSLVKSDQGGKNNGLTGHKYTRTIHALVIGRDSVSTRVLITGTEVREGSTGQIFKRLRIDNRAGGAGGKLWCRMVGVARALDSTQLSEDALASDACRKDK